MNGTRAALLTLSLLAMTAQAQSETVTVSVVGFNDFHGNLMPTSFRIPDPNDRTKTLSVQAGGIETISSIIKDLRRKNPNTVVVGGGDLIGASPLVSSLLNDEPTIAAMNELRVYTSVVGNHEFDKGLKELQRMQNGGCDSINPKQACKYSNVFKGANFKYIAANVLDSKTGKPIFPAYKIRTIGGVKVAFVGAVLRETPTIVVPSGVAGLTFADEVESINKAIPEIRKQGAEAIVALVHQGGTSADPFDVIDCKTLQGPIVDIAKKLDPAVDVIMTGHTHRGYQCRIDGRLVTQGDAYGHLLTQIDLTIDKTTRDVVTATSKNLVVDPRTVKPDPRMTAIIKQAKTLTDQIAAQPIANLAVEQITQDQTPAGESYLGDLIADAQLYATRSPEKGGAVVAFMNPGGIRANLPANVPNPSKVVTFGDAFTVQPFGNSLVVLTLTGAQIKTLLEQQWLNQDRPRILQVSEGFSYTYDNSKPAGEKVLADTIKINGVTVDPNQKYRVTVNSFLADGGDKFFVLQQGTDRLGGEVDLEALQNYLFSMQSAGKAVGLTPRNRITRLN
ncbi:bifunctional metallophosphatase/5'-nucleotidase [Deinococcus misasensis]|uniref:bifunctional metallophosphatase/5'-nucleotidase n=1 Tax=Deinococcus misasensis TaxID=392413 RepID=UPI000556FFCF|nr:bifunctional metallophosphatase/5'-nucleotidase [Deinococcus misasensis]